MSFGPAIVYRFDGFELDPGKFELRKDGQARHLEPQVLSLLILLAANADRMVSKDEIVERIWGGRAISDAAVASRVKAARQALGDDGSAQRFIRTVHGRGFRFAAPVAFAPERLAAAPAAQTDARPPATDERPSIAVLPFRMLGERGALSFIGEALADELIADLSRLRWLLVIARASTFRFRDREVGCDEIGAALGVRYCLTGTLEEGRDHLVLSVSLARTADSAVIWGERFTAGRSELQAVRHELLAAVVAKLEAHILQHEVERARRAPEAALDAWSSYHLGLDHMFRFNRADNGRAATLFEQALARDPHFSRALSGLSFTCFQDSFLEYSGQGAAMADRARDLAEQALRCDPLDPFAHLNLGRALWFDAALPESIERLSECIALSPNYAQAIYSKAWAEMTQCEASRSDVNAMLALRLSPLDPMRYAMLAVRAVNALLDGDHAKAADLGERAARSPGAHKLIALIAALAIEPTDRERACAWVERARQLDPQVSQSGFFRAFPFAPTAGREKIERILRDLGL